MGSSQDSNRLIFINIRHSLTDQIAFFIINTVPHNVFNISLSLYSMLANFHRQTRQYVICTYSHKNTNTFIQGLRSALIHNWRLNDTHAHANTSITVKSPHTTNKTWQASHNIVKHHCSIRVSGRRLVYGRSLLHMLGAEQFFIQDFGIKVHPICCQVQKLVPSSWREWRWRLEFLLCDCFTFQKNNEAEISYTLSSVIFFSGCFHEDHCLCTKQFRFHKDLCTNVDAFPESLQVLFTPSFLLMTCTRCDVVVKCVLSMVHNYFWDHTKISLKSIGWELFLAEKGIWKSWFTSS